MREREVKACEYADRLEAVTQASIVGRKGQKKTRRPAFWLRSVKHSSTEREREMEGS
jgi:hypothetical protein